MINLNYAIIENNIVTNIVWIYSFSSDDFPNAVPLDGRLIEIGDSYVDGKFYRNGERIYNGQEYAEEALNVLIGENV